MSSTEPVEADKATYEELADIEREFEQADVETSQPQNLLLRQCAN